LRFDDHSGLTPPARLRTFSSICSSDLSMPTRIATTLLEEGRIELAEGGGGDLQ
jgi:hypothetical protein